MKFCAALLFFALTLPFAGRAEVPNDSVPRTRVGWAVDAALGSVAKVDPYERMWLRDNAAQTFGAEIRFTPPATDAFARDYGMPTLGAGLRYGRYRGVKMRKEAAPDWGMAEMVDYTSRMGDIVTAYAFFERPFWRKGKWEADYRFDIGAGWGGKPYNKRNNVDNEIIGSRLLVYFGFGLHATCYVRPDLGLRAGLEFAHHSNGALNRPNKGANFIGPMLGVVFRDAGKNIQHEDVANKKTTVVCGKSPVACEKMLVACGNRFVETSDSTLKQQQPSAHDPNPNYSDLNQATSHSSNIKKGWYATFSVGFGGKTLLEDWLRTQYATAPTAPDYRKESFHVCYALSAQADLMYRYTRRWSSGVGVDLFYASAAHRIADIDRLDGRQEQHSPWSVGVAAKHEVWWHNVALTMSLGVYLYRRMGFTARDEEKPYYERIGLKYVFPRMHGLFIGANVKAHFTKADQTEFVVGIRL